LSRGEFVKFLFQDDLLYPECIEKMVRLLLANPSLGLVFSPRDIILDADKEDPITQEWVERCTNLHTKFNALTELNIGRQLFSQYSGEEFRGNWIAEPSAVMIRKACFDRLSLFNSRLYQICDVEMWLRIMFFYDIGFIREKLSAFRFHSHSASVANLKSQKNWLDQLRLLEGLLESDDIRLACPELKTMRRREIMRIVVRSMIPLQVRLKIHQYFRTCDYPSAG